MSGRRRFVPGAAVVVAALAGALVGPACARDPYEPLEVGQCLPDGAGVEGRRLAAPELILCSEPHRYEVFARRDLEPPDNSWPGGELVEANAKRLCGLSMEDTTGLQPADLPDGVRMVFVAPTRSSWVEEGDREVECLFRFDEVTTSTLVTG